MSLSIELRVAQRDLVLDYRASDGNLAGWLELHIVDLRGVWGSLRDWLVNWGLWHVMPLDSRCPLLMGKNLLEPVSFILVECNEFMNVLSRWIQWHIHLISSVLKHDVQPSATLDMSDGEEYSNETTDNETPVHPSSVSFLAVLLSLLIFEFGFVIVKNHHVFTSLILIEQVLSFLHLLWREGWINEGWLLGLRS